MKKNFNRILSLVLVLMMVLSLAPVSVFAEAAVEEPVTEAAPVEEVAAAEETTPVEETPAAPVEETPATPVEETPAAPVEEAPAAPVEETPAAPVEEAPAAPVEETPAAPVEETPAAPVEETPAAPEEEEEVAEAAPAVSMPAQNMKIEGPDGLVVRVEIPEGALPADFGIRARRVNAADYAGTVNAVLGEEANIALAVDLTFFDSDRQKIEPLKEIKVYMTAPELAGIVAPKVVHIPDVNPAEEVDLLDVPTAENEVAFQSGEFSVYAVVGEGETGDLARATVNFVSKGTTIATMYVKNSDTAAEIEKIVYDPGTGKLDSDEMFLGWTWDGNNNGPQTISNVRSYLENLDIKEGDVVNINAVISKVVTLTYLDENGTAVGSKSENLIGDVTSATFTVDMPYTPGKSDMNFEGWIVNEGSSNITSATYDGSDVMNKVTGKQPLELGTVLVLTDDVTLAVSAPKGHWLVFDENGKGATYNAPQFVESGKVTVKPRDDDEMARYGYTFGGWYTNKECTDGNEFNFGGQITDNTTIYAKWTANARANYTVLIWKQNVNDNKNAADSAKKYDFAESVTVENAQVGSTANAVTAYGSGNDRYATVNGTAKRYTGFHLNKYDQNVTVNTEGTSVVNVYYDRNLVTLTFVHRGNWNWITDQTMTGLYGQTLASQEYTWPTNRWWYDNYEEGWNGYSGAGTRTTFLDAFILSDGSSEQTFYGFNGSGNVTIGFYKADDNGSYKIANTVSSTSGTFYISDKYNGYKAVSYRVKSVGDYWSEGTWGSWITLGEKDDDGYYASVGQNTYSAIDVRYDPLKYNIIYMDGVYVDGDNKPVDGFESRGQLNVVEGINYESDVSSYNAGKANYYAPTYSNFVFQGWYSDERCTQEFTFDKMPEGITVYAKWVQTQYRVFLHPNAGTDSTLNWGSDKQAMNFRISSGGKVSVPTGRRGEYEMVGWYLDEGFTKVFNADAFVLNDSSVTTPYDKTKDMTDPMDKWGNIGSNPSNSDVNRNWITKKLDLYAKWRGLLIGANGIGVVYDANGGSGAPSDTTLYLDDADAVAQAAVSKAPDGKQFKHWVVQKWNGQAYEDTAVTVEPGAIFKVLKANAKITDSDNNDAVISSADVKEDGHYKYTVQLRAEYVDKEKPTPTHITWYSNLRDVAGVALKLDSFTHEGIKDSDATKGWNVTDKADGSLLINEAVTIRSASTYSYPGYTFLGWAKSANASAENLFLKYDAEKNQFTTSDGKVVTQVAADEKQPIDDLYAIWKGEFYVVHSGIDNAEANKLTVDMVSSYDLTANLTEGTLYGGYYLKSGITTISDKAYDGSNWTWKTAETVNGKAITPVAGETYYIKEVPADKFLQPYTHYTYYKAGYGIANLWMISDIDDNRYQETGFVILEEDKPANVCKSLTVKNAVGGKTVTLKASTVFAKKGAPDIALLTYLDVTKLVSDGNTVLMYWITPDGLIVTGTTSRTLNGVANVRTLKKVDSPIKSEIVVP